MTAPAPCNAMSVDVEDWFQVQAYAGAISRDRWDGLDRRVEANTERVLAIFERAGVRATFFTLGWVAERHPGLVRRIVAAGHELASHGHGHELVHQIGLDRFRADIRRARRVLEASRCAAIARPPSPSGRSSRPGRMTCWPRKATPIPPRSSRSATTSMAMRRRRAIRGCLR
jgi:polysaccharide deacetylase family protein (PEP-CTERM system associated)